MRRNKRRLCGKKGIAAISAILAMLLFTILGITTASLLTSNLYSSTDDLQAAQALYVADGGMQYVQMSQLSGDTDFSNNVSPTGAPFGGTPISLSPGQFWVEYLNQQANSVTVRVTSRVGPTVRVVQQGVGQGGMGVQYVTVAGGNIVINSTNGTISGDVALRGNANIDRDVTVNGNIYANRDVQVPTFNFTTYRNMTTTTHTGNLTISSNRTDNLLVNGNVTIAANVTYTGLLYATGNISVAGSNVVVNGTLVTEANMSGGGRTGLQFNAQQIDPDEYMPAILAAGNISLMNNDGMGITGLMSASGNIDLSNSDSVAYRGSFITGGNLQINSTNNLSLTFDATLTAGIPGLQGGTGNGSLSLSSWQTY